MKDELVVFKGVKEGIFIDIKGESLNEIVEELKDKLSHSLKFFHGAKILGIRSKRLSEKNVDTLKLIIKEEYKLDISEQDLPDYLINIDETEEEKEVLSKDKDTSNFLFQGNEEGITRFINRTLRSGQIIEYDGNIVIIGDVNPGALVKATENIIVLGALRGVAHAGANGNLNSIVAAYNLQPTQLRIADIIVRSPDESQISYRMPEIAKVINGEVVIEPYVPRK